MLLDQKSTTRKKYFTKWDLFPNPCVSAFSTTPPPKLHSPNQPTYATALRYVKLRYQPIPPQKKALACKKSSTRRGLSIVLVYVFFGGGRGMRFFSSTFLSPGERGGAEVNNGREGLGLGVWEGGRRKKGGRVQRWTLRRFGGGGNESRFGVKPEAG